MASSALQDLTFDEPNQSYIAPVAIASAAGRAQQALEALAPRLMAMGGLALFAGSLAVAFRVVALDAAHQLLQPAIDFAICGAVGFLGLSISWVHLGDRRAEVIPSVEENASLPAFVPPAPAAVREPSDLSLRAATVPACESRRQLSSRRLLPGRFCPCCGHKMLSLGAARYHCHACSHIEDHGPLSFLDAGASCPCAYCRQNA